MKVNQVMKLAVPLAAALLAACATNSPMAPGAERVTVAEKAAADASSSVSSLDRTFFQVNDDIRVTGKVFRLSESKDLPEFFNSKYVVAPEGPTSYIEIANLIGRVAGLPVQVTPGAIESFTDLAINSRAGKEGYLIEFAKIGSLKQILDSFAARGQLDWSYSEGVVKLHKYTTKTFSLSAIAGSESFLSSMGTSVKQDSEGSKTSSEISATVEGEIPEIWESVIAGVKAIASPKGRIAENRQTGSITVTDNATAMAAIQEYIDQENERLSTTVMYRVDIIEVNKSVGDEFGLSLTDLLYQGGDGAFSLSSGASAVSEAVSALTGTVVRPTSRWNGSQAVVKAISTEMDLVSHRTAFTSEIIGLIARVQEVREQGYLAERSVNTLNATSGVEITQRVETTTEGFAVSMIGMPSSSGGLILQTLVDISNIEAIERRGSDDNYIESPLRLVRNAKSKTLIQPGDTVIAALMEHSYKERSKSGVGHALNWLLGGTSTASNNQNYTVVLVTPYYREI